MKPSITLAVVAVLSLLSGPVGLRGAEVQVPFGHANWLPSPTDPVGFAGQGNGWYPGATTPLVFGEGTLTNAKVKVESKRRRDGYFSLAGPYGAERSLPVYADSKSKNIVWKMATPGWSTSNPVVIGRRVVTTHSPHHVVCWDADTGKVLWKDDLKVMLLPRLATAVQFGHGQLAAYELATGKRLWAYRDPTVQATSVSHSPSPLLWKGLLLINAGGGKNRS